VLKIPHLGLALEKQLFASELEGKFMKRLRLYVSKCSQRQKQQLKLLEELELSLDEIAFSDSINCICWLR
jgi:hypothetical protein